MKPFFTKKQKKMMKERRMKRKRAFSRTEEAAAATAGRPSEEEGVDPHDAVAQPAMARPKEGGAEKKSPPATSSVLKPGSKRRRSSSVDNGVLVASQNEAATPASSPTPTTGASANQQQVVSVVVPSNLSGKEARKFRKDARRKHRAEGKEVAFVDGKDGREDDENEVEARIRKRRKQNQSATKDADIPRINDLVQEAKELAERQKKQQSASEEEEQLSEAYKRQYVALDCEMVGIGTDGKTSVLARVSIVDWNYEVLLDTYVQVESKVVDFRTKYSGIKPKHIKDAMKPNVVRQKVADLVRDKILVGHALQNDLHALLLKHPKSSIRDTSKYRPFQRYHGKWRPRKLRDLVKENLGKTIQDGSHDSVTDAASTMELFRLVRGQWERELAEKSRKKAKG